MPAPPGIQQGSPMYARKTKIILLTHLAESTFNSNSRMGGRLGFGPECSKGES